ncbi:hypothetical protein J6590_023033, partial [Homalodisca vitripennis]
MHAPPQCAAWGAAVSPRDDINYNINTSSVWPPREINFHDELILLATRHQPGELSVGRYL